MKLPLWVEDDVEVLPKEDTGQTVIEVWEGGVTSSTVARLRKQQQRRCHENFDRRLIRISSFEVRRLARAC